MISRNLNNEYPFLNTIWKPTFLNLHATQFMCLFFSASFYSLFPRYVFPTLLPKNAFKQHIYVIPHINSVFLAICSLLCSTTRSVWLSTGQRLMGTGGPMVTEGSYFPPLCYIVTEIKLNSITHKTGRLKSSCVDESDVRTYCTSVRFALWRNS